MTPSKKGDAHQLAIANAIRLNTVVPNARIVQDLKHGHVKPGKPLLQCWRSARSICALLRCTGKMSEVQRLIA